MSEPVKRVKTCTRCNVEKPCNAGYFEKVSGSTNGSLKGICRACRCARHNEIRALESQPAPPRERKPGKICPGCLDMPWRLEAMCRSCLAMPAAEVVERPEPRDTGNRHDPSIYR